MASEKVEYLNNKADVSSVEKLLGVLQELKRINGEVISGSVLEKSIGDLGIKNTSNIDNIIKELEKDEKLENEVIEEKEKNPDEMKTSVVDEGKISELVAEYEKYTEEKGYSDSEALSQIYKENKGKISQEKIEQFVQKQREIYHENIRKMLDKRASEIADELMGKDENLKDKEKIKETIKQSILEEKKLISEDLGKNVSTKEIDLKIKNFSEKNKKTINDVKVDDLVKDIKQEIYEENPNLNDKQKSEVDEYVAFIKKIYQVPNKINKDMGEAMVYAQEQGLSEGQIKVGVDKTESFLKLIENPESISNLIQEYKSVIDKIDWKLPTKIKQCDNVDALIDFAGKSEKFQKLVGDAQKILNWKETLISKVAEKVGLDKFLINISGKVLGQEFVKDSLVILSQKSLEEGTFTILQAFLIGGTASLSVAAATVTANTLTIASVMANQTMIVAQGALAAAVNSGTATAAEIATLTKAAADATSVFSGLTKATVDATIKLNTVSAAAGATATKIGTLAATGMVPVIGWALTALMAISAFLKPVFDKIKGFLSDIGLNFTQGLKNFLSESFGVVGKFASYVIELGENLVIIAGMALAGIPALIIIILCVVLGGTLGYSTYQSSYISSLNPPMGTGDESEYVETISSNGLTAEEIANAKCSVASKVILTWQRDPKYTNVRLISYSGNCSSSLADAGCGPTSVSEILQAHSETLTPDYLVSSNNPHYYGQYVCGNGTYFGSAVATLREYLGNENVSEVQSCNMEDVKGWLCENKIVMFRMTWTDGGHYAVAVAISQNGNLIVKDPGTGTVIEYPTNIYYSKKNKQIDLCVTVNADSV